AQLYRRRARTPFQRHHRRPDDRVDWHVQVAEPGRRETNLELVLRVLETVPWEPGRYLKQVVEEHRSRLPAELHKFERGWGGPIRVRPDELGRVVHGGGAGQFVHWAEDRFLTLRELARLMGYPDAWAFPESRNRWGVSMWLGKNAPVESTTWISRCIRDSLKGVPGRLRGVSDPDRPGEFVVNVTHAYKDPARIVAEVR
ncbi:MAG: DNA cytosine methyltransferase, partial [Actinomycetota bacterium]